MSKYTKSIRELVKERLLAIPSNVKFSVGKFGDFTKTDLIAEIDNETDIGNGIIDMQLQFIRSMPKLLS